MSFWQGKSVLVTGASGFVGLHLVKELISKKSKVVTFSPRPTGIKLIKEEVGSVEDFNKLSSLIKRNNINIIFHLAAQPIVEIGQVNPLKTFDVNIKGTWNVLEAVRENAVKKNNYSVNSPCIWRQSEVAF